MAINLSEGGIQSLMLGETIQPPILQVLGVRKLIHPGSTDRYRIMLSDGIHSINFAMLATQHNHKIEGGEIQDNAIIRLSHHITSKLTKEKSSKYAFQHSTSLSTLPGPLFPCLI
jgi:replication factor A1